MAEFAVNNKVYLATKISLFIVNYRRELRMEADIRIKRKYRKKWEDKQIKNEEKLKSGKKMIK